MTDRFKEAIIVALNDILKTDVDISILEVPPDPKMGDYAFPCFTLSKVFRKNPNVIAEELKDKIKLPSLIKEVKVLGPYLNFFIDENILIQETLSLVNKYGDMYGKGKKKDYTVMIESPGPNTNKPLHLGHVRNIVLGNSLFNLFEFTGNRTVRVDIVNDRGIHICKSMLAYKKYGEGKDPDKKSDHYVGDFYVLYSKKIKEHPELEEETKQMLIDWENGDSKTRELWKKMSNWATGGFKETYDRYGVSMDKAYHESDHYMKGKELVYKGLEDGIFNKDEAGNIIIEFADKNLGKKVVLRADGTSIYITQDMVLAGLRHDDYKMDKMIYVVGNEQIYHFKVLFKIFEKLGFPFAKDCYHLAYGMVYLPEGKMKSREGTVVDADNLADEMHGLATKELEKRYPDMDMDKLSSRAEKIAMAAIKFYILKYDALKDFTYDPKESISFEGETGPYLQYTYARISSIIRKHNKNKKDDIDYSLLDKDMEKMLTVLLRDYPGIIQKACDDYKPSHLCRYLLDLAQLFNEYYHKYKVIQDDKALEDARIALISSIRIVLKSGLAILGIDSPEEM